MNNSPFKLEHVNFMHGEKCIDIAKEYTSGDKLVNKTGIPYVWETSKNAYQLALDCVSEVETLHKIREADLQAIIYVSQSPTQLVPSHSCQMQHDLNLPNHILALDINQGCTGFVQALSLACKILEENKSILIITTDTYREKLASDDRGTKALFTDAASASIITYDPEGFKIVAEENVTLGEGAKYVYQKIEEKTSGNLHMNGREVYLSIQEHLVNHMNSTAAQAGVGLSEIDKILIHQGSKIVLEKTLEYIKKQGIDIPLNLEKYGNSTSSTIPSLLHDGYNLSETGYTMITSYGVGFAQASIIVKKL